MRRTLRTAGFAATTLISLSALAAVVPTGGGRFDSLVVADPSSRLGIVGQPAGAEWNAFRAASGGTWGVWIDRRSSAPLLVQGSGISWFPAGQLPTVAALESGARRLVAANEGTFHIRGAELVLDAAGTGSTDPDHWVVVFDRVVGGVPVEGEQLTLYVTRGNLVSFGASRWGAIAAGPASTIGADAALAAVKSYMGITPQDQVAVVEAAHLVYVAGPTADDGIEHRLAYRLGLTVAGDAGTWVGKVDAGTGRIIAFYDDNAYARVKGGVYPLTSDQNCGDLGCELSGYPMPYASVVFQRKGTPSDAYGEYTCGGKGPKGVTVTLVGPYVKVNDTCGIATVSGNCGSDLDFGVSGGTDCTSPAGLSGDTHAGRSSYYHLNRLKEKARYWLPSNTWLNQALTDKVDIASTCNSYYNGNVNFYKSGGGCNNTAENLGVVAHEYGHGLDANDGGGSENPGEAYADVIAILQTRRSCVGRGFFQSGTCSGYGDTCLSCTGIRDMDWDQHVNHVPATPANFIANFCGFGSGPCAREVHCESYVPAEAIYDLAARDLPATGLDANSSWQLAEKLYYKSRQGSGGNAFNCSLPASDGCGSSAWFTKLLNADDDDGNLANGTPHAAAIFAAFNRHAIACGNATDPSNLSTTICSPLVTPTISVTPGTGSVTVSWGAVTGAANYLILRNDIGCGTTSNVVATVAAPATSYVDSAPPSGFAVYYRVQAQAANTACESGVSACLGASPN
jgi:hypothetical protein